MVRMIREKIGRNVLKQKRPYGGPGLGYNKEKYQASVEIRKRYPIKQYIIERTPGGGKGPADYKVFVKQPDWSKGSCVAVIQVKSSAYVKGAYYDKHDIERLRKSARGHGRQCRAFFLLIEHGRTKWIDAFAPNQI